MESNGATVFASTFPAATTEQWRGAVEKALKGAPFEKRLVTKLYEDIATQPLYSAGSWPKSQGDSGLPGSAPFTRGGHASGAGPSGWAVLTEHTSPDPAQTNAAILTDLQRGATAILLRVDRPHEPGIVIDTLDDLDKVLAEIYLELVPLSIEASADGIAAAAMLAALWQRRGVKPDQVQGALNVDPLGTLAATGSLHGDLSSELDGLAKLAAWTAGNYPKVAAVGVDTSPYHEAGATEVQDLAAAMATGVAYLRALTGAGMDVETALKQIAFTFSVGCDQFLSIAKLRAARRLWGRIAEACGVGESARTMRLHARTARRIMSRRDPWVNMLRTTVANFAAGVGGADSVYVQPFDAVLGTSDNFARRIARNSQILLQEESYVSNVVDPAGGSWYVESLTDHLADLSWKAFQHIESIGGIAAVLTDGSLAGEIASTWTEREKNIARRKDPLTGVSEFPNIFEEPVVRVKPGARDRVAKTAAATITASTIDEAIAAFANGATLAQVSAALTTGLSTTIAPLPRHRLSEAFEALRDDADAYRATTGKWPSIFLVNIGPVAKHTGRATFSKNFFEAGGIQTLGNNGFEDPEAAVQAFHASGARVAILCSSDDIYETRAVDFAKALKQGGVKYLFLAGNPGDRRETFQAAGIDEFVTMGADVLAVLRATLARLEVPLVEVPLS